jgi:hypothetical protein
MTSYPRREVAIKRIEYVVRPPDPAAGTDDYERYEQDLATVTKIIAAETGNMIPQDYRIQNLSEDEVVVSYEVQRVLFPG